MSQCRCLVLCNKASLMLPPVMPLYSVDDYPLLCARAGCSQQCVSCAVGALMQAWCEFSATRVCAVCAWSCSLPCSPRLVVRCFEREQGNWFHLGAVALVCASLSTVMLAPRRWSNSCRVYVTFIGIMLLTTCWNCQQLFGAAGSLRRSRFVSCICADPESCSSVHANCSIVGDLPLSAHSSPSFSCSFMRIRIYGWLQLRQSLR